MKMQSITIQGSQFTIPAPFLAGHALNENEAAAMNQLFAENIRNNFAGFMKKAKDKGEPIPGQDELHKYAETYKFGVRQASGPRRDPVEKAMYELADKRVRALLASKQIPLKSVSDEKFDELVEKVIAKYGDELRSDAEKIVALQKQSADAVADLDV